MHMGHSVVKIRAVNSHHNVPKGMISYNLFQTVDSYMRILTQSQVLATNLLLNAVYNDNVMKRIWYAMNEALLQIRAKHH